MTEIASLYLRPPVINILGPEEGERITMSHLEKGSLPRLVIDADFDKNVREANCDRYAGFGICP